MPLDEPLHKLPEDKAIVTIHELIAHKAKRHPDDIALLEPGRLPLSYSQLHGLIGEIAGSLHACGVGRNDRVALVLPNGPEMAVAFMGVSAAATCAPLNPAYGPSELDYYLSDLRVKALIHREGMNQAAVEAAARLEIPVLRLSPVKKKEAGVFTLAGTSGPAPPGSGLCQADDIALVLHTSGTTSRPKIVPLSHSNLCVSAANISRTLALERTDRCLNVMPLFHIHGLIGAVLSSMTAGASIVCTPGFYSPKFFTWMAELRPTWYTAVPTMHQAILERAKATGENPSAYALRLIRSSSASLAPNVMADLESTFKAPVIESYGMTEASHQMASNPLPPDIRKSGSVGVPAGPEIAIMNEAGDRLLHGTIGEVVIQGENVMRAYEADEQVNRAAFSGGWFRTGDQGYFDEEGYLFLTGRLKEIINRGGEKISPRELDEVLLDHPGIAQAVTFAIPDPRLGEDVGAAVILKEGASLSEMQIREYAASRVASFKAPRVVRILDEIPKGPTGKIQRIGLAQKLGIEPAEVKRSTGKSGSTAPGSEIEKELAAIWREVLGLKTVGIAGDFFALGGDSVLATQLLARVAQTRKVQLPLLNFLEAPTIASMSAEIEAALQQDQHPLEQDASLVAIQPQGRAPALFCAAGHDSNLFGFSFMARQFGRDQPLLGFPPISVDKEHSFHRLEDIAARNVQIMRAAQPHGPYHLAGSCFGGCVAYEMACQLQRAGEQVALLAMMNCHNDAWRRTLPCATLLKEMLFNAERRFRHHWIRLSQRSHKDKLQYLIEYTRLFAKHRLGQATHDAIARLGLTVPRPLRDERYTNRSVAYQWEPGVYPDSAILFRSAIPRPRIYPAPLMGWDGLIKGKAVLYDLPDSKGDQWTETNTAFIVDRLRDLMAAKNRQIQKSQP